MPIPTDRELLAFEAAHPRHTGDKEEAIRAELGVTPARYYQLLDRAIAKPSALEVDPMLVHRHQRVTRELAAQARRRQRA